MRDPGKEESYLEEENGEVHPDSNQDTKVKTHHNSQGLPQGGQTTDNINQVGQRRWDCPANIWTGPPVDWQQ